ncbi:flagellar protein FlaJ [Halovenus aranensis]|uniref:Flagellar protein FlaJ n=1 Tax=Halovenus aranensis TaxID=890420 RepID=A0A1G8RN67_9EURY|nr:archaellar assembly protein FlaJ [Halovenus aranensis]SDJ18514.1 flagellar protein FlaJ [Halovenus aranensis]
MSTDNSSATLNLTLSENLQSLLQSYRQMQMPMGQYVSFILIPSIGFFVVTVVLSLVLSFPMMVRVPIPLLGSLALFSAVFYPKILLSQRQRQLDNRFHLMVTHMTILSTTKIDRMEVFRTLADDDEYGELSNELRRIVELVDTWNQSLDDALRRRSNEVPSETLADFFERLAYTMGAGQSLREYLLTEQEQILENYATVYESSLENIEVMKDLYLSMVLSMTFALVFAVVLPVLTGTEPTLTVSAVILLYIFVQTGFFLAMRSLSPYDPLWYHPDEKPSAVESTITRSFYVGVGLTGILLVLSVTGITGLSPIGLPTLIPGISTLPLPFYAVIPVTPLLIPGLVLNKAEKRVKARDQEFPSFIRALGTTEAVKQSTSSDVLSTLRNKDFGPLSENIDDLYKRLNMRIEPVEAWRYFTADCRSYLIQTFSEMYLMGREMGGNPQLLGELISENMNRVLQLREQRKQATTTLIGLLYGMTAASTFAFFIGLEVVNVLSNLGLDLNTSAGVDVGQIIRPDVYNIPLIEFLLVVVIMFSAMLSALMVRTVDGGHKVNTYMHFVLLSWISSLVAIFTRWLINTFLAVG